MSSPISRRPLRVVRSGRADRPAAPEPAFDRFCSALYAVEASIVRGVCGVSVVGEIDVAAATVLRRFLGRPAYARVPLALDLAAVRFLDTSGLAPLMELTRARRTERRPPLHIDRSSPCVQRLLSVLSLGGCPELDLVAWDALLTVRPGSSRYAVDNVPAAHG
jgi:anti-anti-sigma factor